MKVDTFTTKDGSRRESAHRTASRDNLNLNTLAGAHSLHPGGFPPTFVVEGAPILLLRMQSFVPLACASRRSHVRYCASPSIHARKHVTQPSTRGRVTTCIASHHSPCALRWDLPRGIAFWAGAKEFSARKITCGGSSGGVGPPTRCRPRQPSHARTADAGQRGWSSRSWRSRFYVSPPRALFNPFPSLVWVAIPGRVRRP